MILTSEISRTDKKIAIQSQCYISIRSYQFLAKTHHRIRNFAGKTSGSSKPPESKDSWNKKSDSRETIAPKDFAQKCGLLLERNGSRYDTLEG